MDSIGSLTHFGGFSWFSSLSPRTRLFGSVAAFNAVAGFVSATCVDRYFQGRVRAIELEHDKLAKEIDECKKDGQTIYGKYRAQQLFTVAAVVSVVFTATLLSTGFVESKSLSFKEFSFFMGASLLPAILKETHSILSFERGDAMKDFFMGLLEEFMGLLEENWEWI